jgi:hypothetical protein
VEKSGKAAEKRLNALARWSFSFHRRPFFFVLPAQAGTCFFARRRDKRTWISAARMGMTENKETLAPLFLRGGAR